MTDAEAEVMALARTIVAGDEGAALRMLVDSPALVVARVERGATRELPRDHFFPEILHYVYAGDTALHVAAAAYRLAIAQKLVEMGADVRAKNRRGAEPLHYAADGGPGSPSWNPGAQASVVRCLIEAGADPNAVDMSGVTPLHRAVRTRCAAAVRALLEGGADPHRKNKTGSTAMKLATMSTGRGGSGSPEAKAQQAEIVRMLEESGGTAAKRRGF